MIKLKTCINLNQNISEFYGMIKRKEFFVVFAITKVRKCKHLQIAFLKTLFRRKFT